MTMKHSHDATNKRTKISAPLPVTLLGGFLGAGKTCLLKHILETKHNSSGDAFKCAVIVNDVAELNIDKSLIDQSSLVQSDDVIAMQNGCVCCTLKSDLVDQIIVMANKGTFDYMIIEASGMSEPSEVAQLFAECTDDHDHEEAHEVKVLLPDVAKLDTCVTVVDAAEFFNNFEKALQTVPWSKLMVEQIEYANVVILNKTDLVSNQQLDKIKDHVSLLNSRAKILTAQNSSIDVTEVMATNMYKAEDFNDPIADLFVEEEAKDCCKSSLSRGESPCCRKARTIDSGMSQVILTSKSLPATRHESRFGITSFLYKAQRPFHSSRFHEEFIDKFFVLVDNEDDEDTDCEEEGEESPEEEKDEEAANQNQATDEEEGIKRLQEEADTKQKIRANLFGNVLRSKGFLWTAHSHDLMVVYGQASNAVTMTLGERWKVLDSKAWVGSKEEIASFRSDFNESWGDRRQELVFIGYNMKHKSIQKTLDACLLTDEEFGLGLDGWKATIGDLHLE